MYSQSPEKSMWCDRTKHTISLHTLCGLSSFLCPLHSALHSLHLCLYLPYRYTLISFLSLFRVFFIAAFTYFPASDPFPPSGAIVPLTPLTAHSLSLITELSSNSGKNKQFNILILSINRSDSPWGRERKMEGKKAGNRGVYFYTCLCTIIQS